MTFDNVNELRKIKKLHPNSQGQSELWFVWFVVLEKIIK